MTRPMIQHESIDEFRIQRRLMSHMHDLDHVQVELFTVTRDREDGVDDDGDEMIGLGGRTYGCMHGLLGVGHALSLSRVHGANQ